jgi:hypothetical protein
MKQDGKIEAPLAENFLESPLCRVIDASETKTLGVIGVDTNPHSVKILRISLRVPAGPGHIADCMALLSHLPENLQQVHITSTTIRARQGLVNEKDIESGG